MIQIARVTWGQANRSSVVRSLLLLTVAGAFVGYSGGIFDSLPSPKRQVDSAWNSIVIGAIAIAAYLPALRWEQLRRSRCQDVTVLTPHFHTRWPLEVWGATVMYSLLVTIAGLMPFLLNTDLAISWPLMGQRLLMGTCAIAVTSALAITIASLASLPTTLMAVAACWLVAVTLLGSMQSWRESLLVGNALSIILPPIRVLSLSVNPPGHSLGSHPLWECVVLAASASAACLATTIGIARFRWN